MTDKDLAEHVNERNPHGTRPSDIGAASEQSFSEHKADYTQLKDQVENMELSADKIELDSDKFNSSDVLGGMEELFTNVSDGKNLIGTAIADVDNNVDVPNEATFEQLENAIRDINIGRRWASGSIEVESMGSERISGLDFEPSFFVASSTDSIKREFFYGSKDPNYRMNTGYQAYWLILTSGDVEKTLSQNAQFYDDGFRFRRIDGYSGKTKTINWIAIE